uniref:Grass carp reovirus (GCRV)-induced gene 2g n=1 Tax=Cyprinus carpio TaxID=7962 RepID=A0A8C1J7H8_CYPCA
HISQCSFCAKMWAEDDLGPGSPPCLQSYTAPEEGKVYIMYHGTSIQAALNISTEGFQQSADGMLERGVYLSRDLKKAARYPLHLPEYDTAWCPPKCGMVSSGLEEDCVWDPKRITDIDLISPVQEEQICICPWKGKSVQAYFISAYL